MARVRPWQGVWGVVLFCTVMGTALHAQDVFTTLVSFDGPNGIQPFDSLVQGTDGDLYGTASHGGISPRFGVVFKIVTEGKLSRLHSFCTVAQCADGESPEAPLMQAANGKFYGTTSGSGSGPNYCGTVFEITAERKLTTLHTFTGSDGCAPAGLIQAAGNLYGTTSDGGVKDAGTVFEITPAGKLTSLYSFCSLPNCADGKVPLTSLIQGNDGNFYGSTYFGGGSVGNCIASQSPSCGTVFKITSAGKLNTLYSFCSLSNCADGSGPEASPILDTDGNLYGTTFYGGNCSQNDMGCGTVFKITAAGTLITLYNFCSLTDCADGAHPDSLMQATDGNFYGTTGNGGISIDGRGTIFKITSDGVLTTLYRFCPFINCWDGANPSGGLLQAANGIFYGTTTQGGFRDFGTVFSLDTGLGPFVSFIRNPAKVGQPFGILGYGLTGTSSVSFNSVPTTFKAYSDTLLIATVPSGATTGYVTVTTPSGTLTSNVPFHVIP